MDQFVEALRTTGASKPGFRCGVARVLASMSDVHRQAVLAEIDDIRDARIGGTTARHSCESLARVLREHGHDVSGPVMQQHVAGRCACGR